MRSRAATQGLHHSWRRERLSARVFEDVPSRIRASARLAWLAPPMRAGARVVAAVIVCKPASGRSSSELHYRLPRRHRTLQDAGALVLRRRISADDFGQSPEKDVPRMDRPAPPCPRTFRETCGPSRPSMTDPSRLQCSARQSASHGARLAHSSNAMRPRITCARNDGAAPAHALLQESTRPRCRINKLPKSQQPPRYPEPFQP